MIVVYPTETCYALGCRALDAKAIKRVIELKGRAPDKPMPVIVPDIASWKKLVFVNKNAERLASHFWPGALTLICRKRQIVPDILSKDTLGCRISPHEVASALTKELGPLVATSANISGEPNPYTLDEVPIRIRDAADMVIDGGRLPNRPPSTVFDCESLTVIRQGDITKKQIRDVLK